MTGDVTTEPTTPMSVGDIVQEVGKVQNQPVHIDDQLAELWVWISSMLPDWPWGNITAIGVIVGAIAFVLAFSTGKR